MRRRLLTFLSVLSFFLLVVVCSAWVRSRVVRDYGWAWLPWPADAAGQRWLKTDVDTGGGQLELAWKPWTITDRKLLIQHDELGASDTYHRTFPDVPKRYAYSDPPAPWNEIGFASFSGRTHSSVTVPYWFLALLTAVLPTARLVGRARRRRLVRAGRCPTCGYDLRGSPRRCPECGAAPATT